MVFIKNSRQQTCSFTNFNKFKVILYLQQLNTSVCVKPGRGWGYRNRWGFELRQQLLHPWYKSLHLFCVKILLGKLIAVTHWMTSALQVLAIFKNNSAYKHAELDCSRQQQQKQESLNINTVIVKLYFRNGTYTENNLLAFRKQFFIAICSKRIHVIIYKILLGMVQCNALWYNIDKLDKTKTCMYN